MRWRNVKQTKKSPRPEAPNVRYGKFWPRVMSFITDIFMIGLPISLLTMLIFGYDQTQSAGALDVIVQSEKAKLNPPDPVASIMQIMLFWFIFTYLWHRSGQTPGKKMMHLKVVDARTFQTPSYLQSSIRFVAYFVSLISIVGFFTGLLRKDKRALHDLISRTAVIST